MVLQKKKSFMLYAIYSRGNLTLQLKLGAGTQRCSLSVCHFCHQKDFFFGTELTPPALLRCLRERPLEALLSAPVHAPDFAYAFGPSVDGVVIGKPI